MKKKNILILLVISILFCISSVKAEGSYECTYHVDYFGLPNNIILTFFYGDDNKYLSYSSSVGIFANAVYNSPKIVDFAAIDNFKEDLDKNYILEKSCPNKVTGCKASTGSPKNPARTPLVSITDEGYTLLNSGLTSSGETTIIIDGEKYYIDEEGCKTYKYNGKNPTKPVDDSCNTYKIAIDELKKTYSSNYQEYNVQKDTLINYCSNVISNSSYQQDGDVRECYALCLDVNKDIAGIENLNGGEKTCGFSQRLIIWVGNIIKWIKYIIPVIVIVLGIIDFIKAIASSSDDEMKKAQGRFIKRLVAAALIFIIPFIIEFILDKTGFSEYVSGCEIIDL